MKIVGAFLIQLLQLFDQRFLIEPQITAIALDISLSFAAKNVAQEFLHLRLDRLTRRLVHERIRDPRQRVLARYQIFLCDLEILTTFSCGKRDGFNFGILVTNTGDCQAEAVFLQGIDDLPPAS